LAVIIQRCDNKSTFSIFQSDFGVYLPQEKDGNFSLAIDRRASKSLSNMFGSYVRKSQENSEERLVAILSCISKSPAGIAVGDSKAVY